MDYSVIYEHNLDGKKFGLIFPLSGECLRVTAAPADRATSFNDSLVSELIRLTVKPDRDILQSSTRGTLYYIMTTSSSAIAERPRDACVEPAILWGWVTLRLNFR